MPKTNSYIIIKIDEQLTKKFVLPTETHAFLQPILGAVYIHGGWSRDRTVEQVHQLTDGKELTSKDLDFLVVGTAADLEQMLKIKEEGYEFSRTANPNLFIAEVNGNRYEITWLFKEKNDEKSREEILFDSLQTRDWTINGLLVPLKRNHADAKRRWEVIPEIHDYLGASADILQKQFKPIQKPACDALGLTNLETKNVKPDEYKFSRIFRSFNLAARYEKQSGLKFIHDEASAAVIKSAAKYLNRIGDTPFFYKHLFNMFTNGYAELAWRKLQEFDFLPNIFLGDESIRKKIENILIDFDKYVDANKNIKIPEPEQFYALLLRPYSQSGDTFKQMLISFTDKQKQRIEGYWRNWKNKNFTVIIAEICPIENEPITLNPKEEIVIKLETKQKIEDTDVSPSSETNSTELEASRSNSPGKTSTEDEKDNSVKITELEQTSLISVTRLSDEEIDIRDKSESEVDEKDEPLNKIIPVLEQKIPEELMQVNPNSSTTELIEIEQAPQKKNNPQVIKKSEQTTAKTSWSKGKTAKKASKNNKQRKFQKPGNEQDHDRAHQSPVENETKLEEKKSAWFTYWNFFAVKKQSKQKELGLLVAQKIEEQKNPQQKKTKVNLKQKKQELSELTKQDKIKNLRADLRHGYELQQKFLKDESIKQMAIISLCIVLWEAANMTISRGESMFIVVARFIFKFVGLTSAIDFVMPYFQQKNLTVYNENKKLYKELTGEDFDPKAELALDAATEESSDKQMVSN